MPTRKSTTARARTVYTSPEGRVVVTRTEDADYNLSVDNQPAGVFTNAHDAEVAGLVELEYRVKQERFAAAADEAAELATCELAADGLRIASPDEAGWWLRWIDRRIWVTDAPAAEQAATDEAEMEGMAYHAQRNAEAAAADEADEAARNFSDEADEAYQEAYRAGKDALGIVALAMDASMDMTCYCQLCGGDVMPDQACMVGERLACPHCEAEAYYATPASNKARATAHIAALAARFIAGENPYFTACRRELAREPELDEFVTWMARQYAAYGARPVGVAQANAFSIWLFARAGLADPPTLVEARPGSVRLLWSWAGNAAALRGLVSERRAAWMAQQQRWLLAADAAGLAATEHYEVA